MCLPLPARLFQDLDSKLNPLTNVVIALAHDDASFPGKYYCHLPPASGAIHG